MMDKVYYDDSNINSGLNVIYAQSRSHRYAFRDAAFSVKFTAQELLDAYLSDAIIFIDEKDDYDEYIRPTGFLVNGNDSYIIYNVRFYETGDTTYIGLFQSSSSAIESFSTGKTIAYIQNDKAYITSDFSKEFTRSALRGAYLNGMLIQVSETQIASPVGYFEENGIGKLYYIPYLGDPSQIPAPPAPLPTSTVATLKILTGFADPS